MPAILLPVFGHIPTETEMTPMRLVDYALAERLALTVAIVLLFGLVLYFLAVGYRWQAVSRSMEETPRLVLLSAREWVAVLLAAVAPLALYLVYARFSGFAGRELSLVANLPRFPLDLLATFILAIVLPLWLARRILRRRCVEQGITAPSPALERVSRLLGTPGAAAWSLYCGYMVLFTLLLACFPMPAMGQMTTEAWASRAQPLSLLLSTAFLLLFLGGLHFIPLLWSMRQRALAPYFGTLARSLAPVAAVLLLLAAGVLYPALRAEERALIQRDTLIFYHPGQPRTGLTPVEARVCEEVRGELLEAFGE